MPGAPKHGGTNWLLLSLESQLLMQRWPITMNAELMLRVLRTLQMTLLCLSFSTKFDGYELVSRRRLSDEPIAAEPPIPVVPFEAHPLKSLLTLPKYKKNIGSKEGARRKCYVCAAQRKRHNAHYFCVTCSDVSQGSIVVICGHNSLRGTSCHAYHCQNVK